MTRPFRFGVVAPLTTDLPTWRDRVRRIAGSGYSTLLMPDGPQRQPAPGPTLAYAAAQADLRVGTWVYASPLRPAWSTAWEAHTLSLLTEGRFEMGIGTGRPGIEEELRDRGMPVVPRGERQAQVREIVTALRDLDGPDLHTPVAMAVRGQKSQALAAEFADTVTFAVPAGATRAEVAGLARGRRGDPAAAGGDRLLLLRLRRRLRRRARSGRGQARRTLARPGHGRADRRGRNRGRPDAGNERERHG